MWPIRPIDRANVLKTGIVAIVDGTYYDIDDIEYMTNEIRDNLIYVMRRMLGDSLERELSQLNIIQQIEVLQLLSSQLNELDDLELHPFKSDTLAYDIVRNALCYVSELKHCS